jgi:hypothetical protein
LDIFLSGWMFMNRLTTSPRPWPIPEALLGTVPIEVGWVPSSPQAAPTIFPRSFGPLQTIGRAGNNFFSPRGEIFFKKFLDQLSLLL